MNITPITVNGTIIIEPNILSNGKVWCCSSCPQFGYPDGNGTVQCCRLTEGSDSVCEPYYLEHIKKLKAEIISARKTAILDCIQVLEQYSLRFNRESGQTISSILGVLSSVERMLLNLAAKL